MKAWGYAAALSAMTLAGCALENRVEVQCNGIGVGYQCTVKHVSGSDAVNACWTVNVTCVNGSATSGGACQRVDPSGQASRLIPLSAFPHAELCDLPSSVSVTMGAISVVD